MCGRSGASLSRKRSHEANSDIDVARFVIVYASALQPAVGAAGPARDASAPRKRLAPFIALVEGGKGDQLFPSWLPGSDRVLFSASTTTQAGAPSQILALDLKTFQRTVLLQSGSQPEYVDSGHLVYASADALYAARFDPSTATMLGPSVPVVEQVLTAISGSSNYAVSRTGTLAYVPGETAVPRRALAWIDRQGREEVLKAPLRGFADPRLSGRATYRTRDHRGWRRYVDVRPCARDAREEDLRTRGRRNCRLVARRPMGRILVDPRPNVPSSGAGRMAAEPKSGCGALS